ncbi:hypothetical protein NRIC_36550 [Enterococcus florum]|uniref:Uncharacterized protein n=1 Tax=Enterococcus florum TaxID=2480627 RepID=A0A4P5PG63_9ENTE|nr:hypothetical protein [Enterococcus florum]GCF95764.1 hypothetical protein NRIC_36550 [Enterococcus florum]
MKKIIATALVGAACLMSLSGLTAEAAQVNTRGAGVNKLGYCLITGEERVSQADCPIGQNRFLPTQNKTLTSNQSFLLAAARQRPQDGTGYKNGRNGGTGQNAGNGKQDGTGPGCADGPRAADCPYWEEKQTNNGTNSTAGETLQSFSQSNTTQSSAHSANKGHGNGVRDGSGGGTGKNAGNGLRHGRGADGQRGHNAGTCIN